VARPKEDQFQFDVLEQVHAFEDAQSVVASDPNGDGYVDLMVADAEGLWLSRAEFK
jgi:hypothetical protein